MDNLDEYVWCCEQLARYRYKPGWRLEIVNQAGWLTLLVEADLPDSRAGRHDQTVRTSATYPLPVIALMMGDERIFADWLRDTLCRREAHEVDEWLRRDERVLFDPHAEEALNA